MKLKGKCLERARDCESNLSRRQSFLDDVRLWYAMTREGPGIESDRPWTAISAATSWNIALLNLTSPGSLLRY